MIPTYTSSGIGRIRAESDREAVYGLPERYRDQLRRRPRRQPRVLPDGDPARARPAGRAGLIADVVIDAKSGVSGAGRAATEKTHFVSVDENVNAYGVPGHRHTPEIEQELAGLGAMCGSPSPASAAAGPGRACVVLRDRQRGGQSLDLDELYADAYASEPFVEISSDPPGVRAVRETNICRISVHRDARTGPGARVRGHRQPLEGCRVPGRPEPEPDVRAPGGRGNLVTPFFRSRWIDAPDHARVSCSGRDCPRLQRGRRGLRDQARGPPRPGAARLRLRAHDQRGPLHALWHPRGSGAVEHGAGGPGGPARRGRQLGQRQRGHRRPGLEDAASMRQAAADVAGVPARVRGGGLDRGDRGAAADRAVHAGIEAAGAQLRPMARRTSPRRSRPPTPSRNGSRWSWSSPAGPSVSARRPKGRG